MHVSEEEVTIIAATVGRGYSKKKILLLGVDSLSVVSATWVLGDLLFLVQEKKLLFLLQLLAEGIFDKRR
jgi:hypothetical protein